MRAFLLAAGFGTRLRPLTLDRPKPLVPVCGHPMLDYALALLRRHGIEGAVVNAHHLAEQVQAWAARQDMALEVSVEAPHILGTGGGLRAVRQRLGDPFVVVNGDILSDVDLGALLRAAEDADAVMALRTLRPGEPYGVVASDARGRVVDLVGLARCEPEGTVDRSRHFTGVHALRPRVLDRLPEGESCIVRQAYAGMVAEQAVLALPHQGTWFDVGTPEAYLRANLLAVEGSLPLPLDPFAGHREPRIAPGSRVVEPVWLGDGAVLEDGCTVGPRAVVGAGARVGSGALLRDSVVWDGCAVAAGSHLEGAIVYDSGVLAVRGSHLVG